MDALSIGDLKAVIAGIAGIMTEKKDELIRLDGAMGDGDLGLTMEKAFTAARDESQNMDEPDAGKLLIKIGMTIARAAPSTMGTLVATGFMSGGKALPGVTSIGVKELSVFFDAFVAGIMQRGKSKPGEKTLIDVLHPAAQAMSAASASGASLADAMKACRDAAAAGLIRTRDMIAQHGRVAYYQEQSLGKEDPGAVAAAYLLQGFWGYVIGAT